MASTNGIVKQLSRVDHSKSSQFDEKSAEKQSSCPGVDKLLEIYDSPEKFTQWVEERNGKREFDVDEVVEWFNLGEKAGPWLKAKQFNPEEEDPILILSFQYPRFYELNGSDVFMFNQNQQQMQMVVQKILNCGAQRVDGTDFAFYFPNYPTLNKAKKLLKNDMTFRWAYYYNNNRQAIPLPPNDVRLIPTIKSIVMRRLLDTSYELSDEDQFFEL